MSLAYRVEELLALRDSVSESAVSIEKFADEDVIKEHVLRPSASANLVVVPTKSFRQSPVLQVAPVPHSKKISPSPSIKRGKAEKLLKEHGSPPGIRVTAGGRIVPSDLQPLGASRISNNTYKPQALRVTSGNAMSATQQPGPSCVPRVEIIGGQPVLLVGDRMFALPVVSEASSSLPPTAPGTQDQAPVQTVDPPTLSTQRSLPILSNSSQQTKTQIPVPGADVQALKAQQSLKRQELRTVEQTEVLQASHQSDAWRASMIEKKKGLIVELDTLRKQIAAAEIENIDPVPTTASLAPAVPSAGPTTLPSFPPTFQQPGPQPLYAYPTANPYGSLLMYPPPFSAYPGLQVPEQIQVARNPISVPQNVANGLQSPGSANRRSHAIEIKPPRENAKKQSVSALDPKSPTYEPPTQTDTVKDSTAPMPSSIKRSILPPNENVMSGKKESAVLSHKPSFSSIDTTDFFPTNTHEYSSTRLPPKGNDSKHSSNEDTAVPSTPDKNWPASPWNEGYSSRSRGKESVAKLTSWPEAFGKSPSLSSLKKAMSSQPPTAGHRSQNSPREIEKTTSTSFGSTGMRTSQEQRTGTEENWSILRQRPARHMLSTYQEGYQAGYDHVGIPDNADVLKGYVQGLLQFMADEETKGRMGTWLANNSAGGIDWRTPSLRGLLSGSLQHDSAISMTFSHGDRGDAQIGSQENVRSARGTKNINAYKDAASSPDEGQKDVTIKYTLCNEVAQDVRHKISSTVDGSHGRYVMPVPEQGRDKEMQDQGITSHADRGMPFGGYLRQFSGNQIHNRSNGTPYSMQRYYPVPKEWGPNASIGEVAVGRPIANHRLSGLDGAMDDLAGLVMEASLEEQRATETSRTIDATTSSESPEADASCFRPSNSKGKQKATSSPTKSAVTTGEDHAGSSPGIPPESPKKSAEHSPAKAKLDHVTNKFRRARKDDPRMMSPKDKMKHSQKWRERFQYIKKSEQEEINAHRLSGNNNARK